MAGQITRICPIWWYQNRNDNSIAEFHSLAAEDIADFGCNDVADDISADLLLLKQQQRPVLPLLDVRNQDISIKTNRISSTKEIHPAVDSAEKLLFLSDLKYFIHTRYHFCVF